ncbi:MAG: transcription-repair coupling factor [Oscillospiraceae bacterium]|nr:transcription-repair coupling factor [Oscillospiraceae bacterium]
MKIFQDFFGELKSSQVLADSIKKRISPISVSGLSNIHKAQLLYTHSQEGKVLIAVTGSEASAKRLCDDINEMAEREIAVLFPSKELSLTHSEGASADYEHQRISALVKAVRNECCIICAGIEAVMQPTIPPDILIDSIITIESDSEIKTEKLSLSLSASGYQRCEMVEGAGQFSIRGSIIDIFPVQSKLPVRIELFGDDVDSISYFETDTQRRTEHIERIEIPPASELVYNSETLIEKISEFQKSVRGKHADTVKQNLENDIIRLESGEILSNIQKYYPLIYKTPSTVFDYVDENVFFSEYSEILEVSSSVTAQYNEDVKILLEEGQLCKGLDGYYLELPQIHNIADKHTQVYMNNFMQGSDRIPYEKLISFDCLQTAVWSGDMSQLFDDLETYCSNGYRIILAIGSQKTLPIVQQDIEDKGIPCFIINDDTKVKKGSVYITPKCFSSGFEYPENKTVLITQSKSLDSSKKKRKKAKNSESVRSLADIAEGDLIVHSDYGIGRFIGIKKLEFEDVTKDYITIQYAGTDKLYVPVTQLDMVSKYIGPRDDSGVKLNKLSSTEWQKTRNKVKKSVRDMADELVKLYAKREQTTGFAFFPDDEIQRDFEERFPYSETDDQLRSIEEIKSDMERARPMDRLLCGDVGFGKTEVAFRACMKCVLSGKQCAILAPTTVLAWQHYQTALRRFEGFPLTIELLSRYRTPKQQAEIIRKLKKGQIDLLIGTHKILQKNVVFKDLGLAVIDEEQRFGVAHKEKFKQNFPAVDILTLSATPIPRTLNMAMSGIRDMSVIEEPPQDRHPVQTYVIEYNEGIIAQAITRELKRGGQVYYIHNRVETIQICAGKLAQMFPNAKIAYAHGQMEEEKMSDIWRSLVEHEIDILVCTTIIETGVDVPNVNTLIIENSDRFGLSQLYQLRGRVGRSNRRAYAFFTFQKDKIITEVASKRLSAMKEFTQFGSGFRIAMRDLEIRGAGSILGGKQHGQMEAVGYDMYIKLLSEAVAEAKGETLPKSVNCTVDIQINAHIPENYISSLNQRISVYKKIMTVENEYDKTDLIDELIDRYGDVPESVIGLIDISLLRNTASMLGISEITQRNGQLYFYTENLDMKQAQALSQAYKGKITLNGINKSYVAVKIMPKSSPFELMKDVVRIMRDNR